LEGWKFQDVVDREYSIDPVVAELDNSATDWLRLIRHIDAVVLFGNDFGELMRPMGEHCTNWTSVPREKFCLAVTIPQLRRIAKKHGRPDQTPIKLAQGVYWHHVEHPFKCSCGTPDAKKHRVCNRSQTLQSRTIRLSKSALGCEVLSAADNDNGAVIFGGRKLQKLIGERDDSEAGEVYELPGSASELPGSASEIPDSASEIPGSASEPPGSASGIPDSASRRPGKKSHFKFGTNVMRKLRDFRDKRF
jgi:hypothetical protein